MAVKSIDALMLKKMFLSGAAAIEAKKEQINELNVFPVPDGDTGTNMTLTIMSAAKEVAAIENPTFPLLCKAMSSGSLRGARGNSGVILSQLLRGFTKEVTNCTDSLNVATAVTAFGKAVETAYKAVMKPKEGTILTVARGGAERAQAIANDTDDFDFFLAEVIKRMKEVLDYTPELLPVLKEAGVVDSGGCGLLTIMQGAYDAMMGRLTDTSSLFEIAKKAETAKDSGSINTSNIETAEIKFGYCTEFIVQLEKPFSDADEQEFKSFLMSIGDSIVLVAADEMVKVHVHTNHPGQAFEKGLTYGSLTRMKVDNMREEHNEKLITEAEKQAAMDTTVSVNKTDVKENANMPDRKDQMKDCGFIAVSIGSGINEIFKGLGVDYVIEGGQTMNPSTEDMLNAISAVNAKNIFILPNNGNIILAANQAKELTEGKNIYVIPSKTVPQGISAMINYIYDKSPEENESHMTQEMMKIKSGEVTYAVRDTTYEGKVIKQNDIMGIGDKGIAAVGKDIEETALELADTMIGKDTELVSIYYGADRNEEQAAKLADMISEKHSGIDVETNQGGQPIYYYVISAE